MNDPRYALDQMRRARLAALAEMDMLLRQAAFMVNQSAHPEALQNAYEDYAREVIRTFEVNSRIYLSNLDERLTRLPNDMSEYRTIDIIPQEPERRQTQAPQSTFPQVEDVLLKATSWLDRLGQKLLTGD